MEYKIEKTPKGDVKVKKEFTPARRYSFLVGKNESSHTAQSCFVDILINDTHNLKLNEIEEAFNIEKVTKEFFLKYRNLFLLIKEELDKVVEDDPKVKKDFAEKGVDTVNFAKKFLGQIVFLYFLQKKGWFGVERDGEWGTGPKNFLRQLFNKKYGNYKNFFNDILEPLFYEALAQERDDDFYSRFNCKIPFLNGGLFEPIGGYDWVHTDINLSNEIFSNRNDNYEGNGVLDIFDLFNFTVKEDEPLEKEVAIDPELLGKIYEKFNAIRPDNYEEYRKALKSGRKGEESKFNKKFGVYYTPREIVHYMSQESLINYLHTVVNQELRKQPVRTPKQIKLIGPADPEQLGFHTDKEIVDKKAIEELIKYGEQFTENEQVIEEKKKETKTYNYQLLPDIRKNAKVIDEKLKDIRVCDPAVGSGAFPVGMMVEIVKTRNVLSVFINEPGRTLYNFKRECIEKSLYGVDIDPGAVEIAKLRLWLSLIVDEEDINKIKPLPNLDYKIMQGNSLISEFMGIDLDNDKQNNENAKLFSTDETKELYEMLKIKKDELLNQTNTNKKKILKKEIENLVIKIFEIKLQEQKSDYFRKIREIEEKWERHQVKEEREREIKREKDVLSRRTGFNLEEAEKQLRQYTSNQKIRPFFPWKLYFSEIFQEKDGFDVVIANPPYVADISKKQLKGIIKELKDTNNSNSAAIFIDFAKNQYIHKKGIVTFIVPKSLLYSEKWFSLAKSLSPKTSVIVDVEKGFKNVLLEQVVFIYNQAQNVNKYQAKKFVGNKFIDKATVQISLIQHFEAWLCDVSEEEIAIAMKMTKGVLFLSQISYTIRGLPLQSKLKQKGEISIIGGKNIQQYAVIGAKGFLKKKDVVNFNKKIARLLQPKIISQNIVAHIENPKPHIKITSSIDTNGNMLSVDTVNNTFLKEKNYSLFFLLAILNSTLISWYAYKFIYGSAIRTMHFDNYYIGKIPVHPINKPNQQPLITLVDHILAITKDSDYLENPAKQAKVKEYEHQIDQMVYELYDLAEEEIKIVENSIKKSPIF